MSIKELNLDEINFFRKAIRGNIYTIFYYICSKLKQKNEKELTTQQLFLLKTFNYDISQIEKNFGGIVTPKDLEELFRAIDLEQLKKDIAMFFSAYNISLFINYINSSNSIKENDCFRFVFRVLHDAFGAELKPFDIPNSYQDTELFEQLGVTRTSPPRKGFQYDSINNIQLKKPLEIGDIIVYRLGEKPDHIGFVVSNDGMILSKEGTGFVWIHPFNAFYDDFEGYGNIISFMRVKDERFRLYFQQDFLRAINKMKLEINQLIEIVEEELKNLN